MTTAQTPLTTPQDAEDARTVRGWAETTPVPADGRTVPQVVFREAPPLPDGEADR